MRSVLLGLLLILPILSGVAVAHEPDTFTVIVREDMHEPAEVNLIVNDTVHYFNVDNRTNFIIIIGWISMMMVILMMKMIFFRRPTLFL